LPTDVGRSPCEAYFSMLMPAVEVNSSDGQEEWKLQFACIFSSFRSNSCIHFDAKHCMLVEVVQKKQVFHSGGVYVHCMEIFV